MVSGEPPSHRRVTLINIIFFYTKFKIYDEWSFSIHYSEGIAKCLVRKFVLSITISSTHELNHAHMCGN